MQRTVRITSQETHIFEILNVNSKIRPTLIQRTVGITSEGTHIFQILSRFGVPCVVTHHKTQLYCVHCTLL